MRATARLTPRLACWSRTRGPPPETAQRGVGGHLCRGFSAAADFLGPQAFVNRNRIGAIGIHGGGNFVISTAKIDPRMKAIAMLFITGGQTHSREFSEDAWKQAAEPVASPCAGRGHVDLYDRVNLIPWD